MELSRTGEMGLRPVGERECGEEGYPLEALAAIKCSLHVSGSGGYVLWALALGKSLLCQ